jgi:HSP90 family molecular chaperone
VANAFGWSGNMERIMRSQAYARQDDSSSSFYSNQKKTLEINPRHALIRHLAEGAATDTTLGEKAGLLLDLARVQDGDSPRDPGAFARLVAEALAAGRM